MLPVDIKTLPHFQGLDLPTYATAQSAGLDLPAAVQEDIEIASGEFKLIPTGLSLAIPAGYEAQVRPRSGLALKHGISVLNSPGTIDADYRGEVGVILINHGPNPFVVQRGERIAQLVFASVTQAELVTVPSLNDTERGQGGFGSTGS